MDHDIQVGDEVLVTRIPLNPNSNSYVSFIEPSKGTVIYVHSEGRFVTVEFAHYDRQCFNPEDVTKIRKKR